MTAADPLCPEKFCRHKASQHRSNTMDGSGICDGHADCPCEKKPREIFQDALAALEAENTRLSEHLAQAHETNEQHVAAMTDVYRAVGGQDDPYSDAKVLETVKKWVTQIAVAIPLALESKGLLIIFSGVKSEENNLSSKMFAMDARIGALETALKPFSVIGKLYLPVDASDRSVYLGVPDSQKLPADPSAPTVGDWRRAAQILQTPALLHPEQKGGEG